MKYFLNLALLLLVGVAASAQCTAEYTKWSTYKATGQLDGWHAYDIAKLIHLRDDYRQCRWDNIENTKSVGLVLPVFFNGRLNASAERTGLNSMRNRGGLGFIQVRDGRVIHSIGMVAAIDAYENPNPAVLIKNKMYTRQFWVPMMAGAQVTDDFALLIGMAPSRVRTDVINNGTQDFMFRDYSIEPCAGAVLVTKKNINISGYYVWGSRSPFGNQFIISLGTTIKK